MTLSEYQTYIKRDFKRTDKDTEITQAVNDTIIWIATIMPHGGYKFQSYINTVIGREDYAIPSTLIHIIHPIRLLLGATSADSGYPLRHLTKEEYDRLEPNPNRSSPSTGRPDAYTIFSRSILISPPADSVSTILEINWSKRPTSLSLSADTPSLGSEWDEIVKHGSLERLFAGIGLYGESQFWASQYRDQEGNPIGMCKRLFDIEKNREETAIRTVVNNDL